MTTCSRCGGVRGESPESHPFSPPPRKVCPFCKADVSGPAVGGQLRCPACAAEFPDYEEWVRQCRRQAYSAWPRPTVPVEPPAPRPAGLKAMGWTLIGLGPVGVATALVDGIGAAFWIALVLGLLQAAAGILLLREVRAAGAFARLAAGLSTPFLFPWGAWLAVLFEQFSRPDFARYFGVRPDPAGPRTRQNMLLWLSALAGIMAISVSILLPGALRTAEEWNDPPTPMLAAWSFAAELFSPRWWRALLQFSLPVLVLWCWSRISRVAFVAVGASISVALLLLAGPLIVLPLHAQFAAQRAVDFEAGRHAPTLLRGLGEPDPKMRIAAARGLENLGRDAATAAPALVRALEDPDRRVRTAAACALGRLDARAEAAVPVLVRVLKEEGARPIDRRRATVALARLGPLSRPALWILLDGLGGQEECAEALAEIGVPAIPGLVEAMGNADPVVRRRAAATLARNGASARSAVDNLTAALKDADPGVRVEAVRAIGEIQGAKALPLLNSLLGDPVVGEAAAAALCLQGEREGLAPLQEGGIFLNVFRRPATWDHLRKSPVDADLEGSGREILAQIAAKALMKLEIAPEASFAPSELEILGGFRRFRAGTDRSSLADVLRLLGLEILLDSDTLRVVPRAEARRFWSAWLSKERDG